MRTISSREGPVGQIRLVLDVEEHNGIVRFEKIAHSPLNGELGVLGGDNCHYNLASHA